MVNIALRHAASVNASLMVNGSLMVNAALMVNGSLMVNVNPAVTTGRNRVQGSVHMKFTRACVRDACTVRRIGGVHHAKKFR